MPLDGTLYEDEILRVLRTTQERIRNPENWCQYHLAKTASGEAVWPNDPDATQWCVVGARELELGGYASRSYLEIAAHEFGYGGAVTLNNTSDHPTVMAMFDRAQELRQAEIMETVEVD